MMKTKIILILFMAAMMFLSCSKTLYYACETEYYGYCTLEVKKRVVIYRASSYEHIRNTEINLSYIYIYIHSEEDEFVTSNYLKDNFIYVNLNVWTTMFVVKPIYKTNYVLSPVLMNITDQNLDGTRFSYQKSEDGSLELYHGVKYNSMSLSMGLNWVPERMYKVKKIDYSKFDKDIQHLNLKNPKKDKN